jgi:Saxitoxin biosynthesis operon protein SxtJ
MKNYKSEPVKTCLTIAMGFLIVFIATKLNWALIVALAVGLTGLFSPFLGQKIDFLWMKLAGVLSLIVPNILLGAVFYLFLFPISLLARLFRKNDPLLLNNTADSTFTTENKTFDRASFEKPW